MKTTVKSAVTTLYDVKKDTPLPRSWHKAAGLLRHKRKQLELHISRIHGEWNKSRA